jgi:hypothetical protein
VAVALDAAFAFVSSVVIAGRYDFESPLQYIAGGVLGHSAFTHGGLTGWLFATPGLLLHLVISFTVAAVYFVFVWPLARTWAAVVVAGLLYGAAIWVFNDAVVLPLSGTAQPAVFRRLVHPVSGRPRAVRRLRDRAHRPLQHAKRSDSSVADSDRQLERLGDRPSRHIRRTARPRASASVATGGRTSTLHTRKDQ